jgi:hypothetical protein
MPWRAGGEGKMGKWARAGLRLSRRQTQLPVASRTYHASSRSCTVAAAASFCGLKVRW